MSNHESDLHLASIIEASQTEAGFSRPSSTPEARNRALQILKVVREHPKASAALVLTLLGQQLGLARPIEPAQAQRADAGDTTLVLPIVANNVDIHRLPQPQPITKEPTHTRTPQPSNTPAPTVTPTELSPTAEAKIKIGFSDNTVGAWDQSLDPYGRQHSLAQLGLRSYDGNPVDFDAEAEGTGVIRASGGAPVAYRLRLAEPGQDVPHYLEVSFATLAELVDPEKLAKLLRREYDPSTNPGANNIDVTIARNTKLYDASNGAEALPLAAAEAKSGTDPLRIIGGDLIPAVLEQTYSLTDQVSTLPDENAVVETDRPEGEKVYGNLRPVATMDGITGSATWHTFVRGSQELPKDSGFELRYNGSFEGYGVVHLSYWLPNQREGATGIGLAVTDTQLFYLNYDRGQVDGPYTFDLAVAPGTINVAVKFKDEHRKEAEIAVVDATGKTTYFNVTLRFPLDQFNVVNVNAAYSAFHRGDAFVENVGLEIPVDRDRLLRLPADPDLQRLNEFNALVDGLGKHTAIPRFTHLAQVDDAPYDPLFDQAAALFVDQSPTHATKGVTYDDELKQVGNPMIASRPYRDAELRAAIKQRRVESPGFFAALAYDVRSIALDDDPGYTTEDFRRDLQKWHEGAERSGDLMLDAPMGVLGKSGGIGDFVSRLAPASGKPDARARKVAETFVQSMPADANWNAILQLDPGMLMGQTQMDTLITTLTAMNSVDRTSIEGVIATALPDYSMNRSTYRGYLLSLKGRLNAIGLVLHIRDSDIGLLTPDDVEEITANQVDGAHGLAMLGDPRNQKRMLPSATPLLHYDPNARTLEYTEDYTPDDPRMILNIGAVPQAAGY